MTHVLALAVAGALAAGPAPAPQPYTDPPFAGQCHWRHYEDGEAPPLTLIGTEPLCVEYSKRDITVTNGGALRFLLAEPARFAVAIPACRYWQVDHWRVRLASGQRPYLSWNGSYWFDKARGTAGVRVRDFAIAGRPVGVADAVAALRPVAPAVADALARYGGAPGESGSTVAFPGGAPCPA